MFKALRARRARSIVEQVSAGMEAGIDSLPAVERAGAMAICNAILKASADHYGREVETSPQSLHRDRAVEIVSELAATHASVLQGVLLPLRKRNMDDVIFAHAMRQVRALEVMIVTYGSAFVPEVRQVCRDSWKSLWLAREHAETAADLLIQFHRHAGSRPLPKYGSGKVSRSELIELARTVPIFLKSKPASPKSKASA